MSDLFSIFLVERKHLRRLKPMRDAKYYARQKADKPGLESIFVDEYIGKYF